MSLFYAPSFTTNLLLDADPIAPDYLYLQELIKCRFIETVRNGRSVLSDTINEIRNYSHICGWLTADNLCDQQDVNEYYQFLMEKFGYQMIDIQRKTLSETFYNNDDTGKIEKVPFISLILEEHTDTTSIKELFNNWMTNNIAEVERIVIENGEKKISNVTVLNTYKITNIPGIVSFAINRFNREGQRLYTKVNIQKKIKINPQDEYDDMDWLFHAAICHTGETTKSGHYYTLLQNCGKWYIFDDLTVPCMREVKMDDEAVIDIVMRECVFVIYLYNQH
jgi:ubiquitin C-terminal hydrolase